MRRPGGLRPCGMSSIFPLLISTAALNEGSADLLRRCLLRCLSCCLRRYFFLLLNGVFSWAETLASKYKGIVSPSLSMVAGFSLIGAVEVFLGRYQEFAMAAARPVQASGAPSTEGRLAWKPRPIATGARPGRRSVISQPSTFVGVSLKPVTPQGG
jgi:hypothetical protein